MRRFILAALLVGCTGGADPETSGTDETDDTDCGADCACVDGDGDGVCDADDRCPGKDDRLDTDDDGTPDCLDPCPADNPDDTDGDGVCDSDDPCPLDDPDDSDGDNICDSDDTCPGGPDGQDADGDGVCDFLDVCPGGDDTVDLDENGTPDDCDLCDGASALDGDGDGLPDDCVLDVLLVWKHDWTADNIEATLTARGWRVTKVFEDDLDPATDWSDYEVVALGYQAGAALPLSLTEAVQLGQVGVVVHRGHDASPLPGLSTSAFYSDVTPCGVDRNDHFITEPFATGALTLDYTYKTWLSGVPSDARVLLSCSGPSLVAHGSLRIVATPYYGHDGGMPWNADGELVDKRSYAWATGYGEQ